MASGKRNAVKRAGSARSRKAGSSTKQAAGARKPAPPKSKGPAKPSTRKKKDEPRATATAAGARGRAKTPARRPRVASAPPRRRGTSLLGRGAVRAEPAPGAVPGLSDEDQIRAAKYLPRELPKRAFEEERFLFPESYGTNRVRLLVRDPEWIFGYWDVDPASMKQLGRELGERTLALSRLTLRVLDPVSGGSSDILLPPGARWWYIRTDAARRTYRAELGVTLPSGEFRRLAESNTVVTPRVGPSSERAGRRLSYPAAQEITAGDAAAAAQAERTQGATSRPWAEGSVDGSPEPKGGASDVFRPGGASDVMRPGASETFRR
jgi:hypothetical protein